MQAIDLFAGAGGFSTGARMAGVHVAWAGNHWPEAVEIHAKNHPETIHALEDLIRVDWTKVPAHDLLLASPACQGHSKARGKEKVHHDGLRATAWAVIDALEVHQPTAAIIENVPEFLDWVNYPTWELALTRMGYRVTKQVLNAADFGVCQARERVFIVAHKHKHVHLESPRLPHIPARDLILWDKGKWGHIHDRREPLAERTMACIVDGQKRYGKRFLVPYFGNEWNARSIDKPLGTVLTNDRFGVVDGDMFRMLLLEEYRIAMGFPADYLLARLKKDALKMLGNAVVPIVAKSIILQVVAA